MTDQTNRILKPDEAMARLKCGRTKFAAIMKSGALDVRKIGGANVIMEASVDKFIASLPAHT